MIDRKNTFITHFFVEDIRTRALIHTHYKLTKLVLQTTSVLLEAVTGRTIGASGRLPPTCRSTRLPAPSKCTALRPEAPPLCLLLSASNSVLPGAGWTFCVGVLLLLGRIEY